MPPGDGRDPVRATMLAILQQLNRAESLHEGRERDQSLALADLERLLHRFWATDREQVRVAQVLGLLVHNGLVRAVVHPAPLPRAHATAHRPGTAQYRITPAGKQFLVAAQAKTERIA